VTTDEHEEWEAATSSAVADSLLAAGLVSAAEEIPGDSDIRERSDTSGGPA
jgi:maltose alpha-D-glucosyltransferase/alpha-amylase